MHVSVPLGDYGTLNTIRYSITSIQYGKLSFIHSGMSNNSIQPTIKGTLLKYVSFSKTFLFLSYNMVSWSYKENMRLISGEGEREREEKNDKKKT